MPKRTSARKAQAEEPVVLEKLLTIKDVANLLQLSTVKVHRMINYSGLPSLKIDGSRRFRPSEVQAWIEQHTEIS